MKKSLASILLAAELMSAPIVTNNTTNRDYIPSTLSGKDRKKRYVRNKMQKESRKINRRK